MADRVRLVPLDYTPRTGGTSWALKQGRRAVMLDCGANLERQGTLLRATRLPDHRGIDDRLELGLLPRLDVFREDLLRDPDALEDAGDLGIEALLLGHGHVDHFGNLFALDMGMETHMTAVTAAYLWAHARCSQGLASETTHGFEREPHPDEEGALRRKRGAPPVVRPIGIVNQEPTENLKACFRALGSDAGLSCSPMKAAGMSFEAWNCDHSLLGNCAWVVHTEVGAVVHLTDFRRHGSLADDTDALVERLRLDPPAAMLVDCTCLGRGDSPRYTEKSCRDRILEIVRGAGRRLVVASFGHRNVERLAAFLRAARATRRRLVISSKTMILLEAIGAADPRFDLSDLEGLAIYDPSRLNRRTWHKDLRERRHGLLVTPDEIARSPHRFVVSHEIGRTAEWMEYQPQGAVFVFSASAAYDEESRARHASIEEWVRAFRMSAVGIEFGSRGCVYDGSLNPSGHCHIEDLRRILDQVRGIGTVVPIHTGSPERIRDLVPKGTRVAVPSEGRTIWL